MKVYLMKPMIALLLFVGVAPSGWAVDGWWQGALCLSDSTGGMAVELLGGQRLDVAAAPVYTSGLVKLIADQGGQSIYLRASNAVAGYFAGAGQFSIERFDQFRSAASGTNDRSYIIGNLLEGLLILDNREQAQGSEIIIETALGRVSVTQGLVSLQINYNSKNQHYNFIFVCSEGVLSLRHASGRSYQVTPGQRLSGVGFAKAPSIELSDATAGMKEPIIEFTARMEAANWTAAQQQAIESRMQRILRRRAPAVAPLPAVDALQDEVRPIRIEYAPAPPQQVPFRGVLQPLPTSALESF
jgi:hypothetical protein